ncbi:MAG: hypothetical protein RLZZ502_1575 [Pseudomonadota bacterium]|jgi:tetratricopeptide (TPR) repeat protein
MHRLLLSFLCLIALVALQSTRTASAQGGSAGNANAAAQSPELNEISRLVRGGQFQNALEKANAYLAGKPKDPLARFLKGVALTELNRGNDAIATFQALTEDYPELPEPYNNLAVLFAGKGQFEKARTALELAIQTHPSYATAHENLGDVYAKLASQAYDKALQLDKGNNTVQSKLSLVRDLFSTDPKAIRSGASKTDSRNTASVSTTPPPAVQVATAPVPTAGSVLNPNKAAQIAAAAAANAKPAITPTAALTPPLPPAPVPSASTLQNAKPEPKPAAVATSKGNEREQILATLKHWANSWAAQDVDTYLAHYSDRFKPQDGATREAWAQTRRERLLAPKKILVSVQEPDITLHDDGSAEIRFKQAYSSDTIGNSTTRKVLVMVKSGSEWKITRERAGA